MRPRTSNYLKELLQICVFGYSFKKTLFFQDYRQVWLKKGCYFKSWNKVCVLSERSELVQLVLTSIPGRIVKQIIKRLVCKHFNTLRIHLSRTSIFKLNQIAIIAVIDQHWRTFKNIAVTNSYKETPKSQINSWTYSTLIMLESWSIFMWIWLYEVLFYSSCPRVGDSHKFYLAT